MSKFHLNIQELVQGDFILNKVNMAFVFQVNCPGCFIYGIPMMNKLYNSFNDKHKTCFIKYLDLKKVDSENRSRHVAR